jgi:hypothetical protein
MNKNLQGVLGFFVLMTGLILPFAHLEQARNDMAPLLAGLVALIVGVCLLTGATRK